MSPEWRVELERFRKMSADQRVTWCGRAILALTILARGTYVPGTDEVFDPRRLRGFNELIHRVAGWRVADDWDEAAAELFFEMVSEATAELRIEAGLLEQLRGATRL
jgi:hypothetical protein